MRTILMASRLPFFHWLAHEQVKDYLRYLAKQKVIASARLGRRWVYDRSELRSLYNTLRREAWRGAMAVSNEHLKRVLRHEGY